MDGRFRLCLVLGALLVAAGIALEAWHAHGLRNRLDSESWAAVGRAIHQQELAGLGLIALALAGCGGILSWAAAAGFLLAALLFSGAVYLKHLAGMEGATVTAPLGGVLHILSWLLVACAPWLGGKAP
ncbi:MAG: DUF423 domain-containing protein [Planctomycetota bacterium]|nr:MAG: DUF423 domain-containing protein [Planctomycetota bacterium]